MIGTRIGIILGTTLYEHNVGIIGDKMRLFYSPSLGPHAAVNMKVLPSESLTVSSGNPSSAAAKRMFSQTNADYI